MFRDIVESVMLLKEDAWLRTGILWRLLRRLVCLVDRCVVSVVVENLVLVSSPESIKLVVSMSLLITDELPLKPRLCRTGLRWPFGGSAWHGSLLASVLASRPTVVTFSDLPPGCGLTLVWTTGFVTFWDGDSVHWDCVSETLLSEVTSHVTMRPLKLGNTASSLTISSLTTLQIYSLKLCWIWIDIYKKVNSK